MVDIHLVSKDGVGVGCSICIDNKASGDEPYPFNVVIFYFLFLEFYLQIDCFFNLFLYGFSEISDYPIHFLFQSCKFLTLFSFLGHMKLRIDSSLFWDKILIFVESVDLLLLFSDAVIMCDVFCYMIIQQIS